MAKLRIQGHDYGAVGLDLRIRAQLGEAAGAKLECLEVNGESSEKSMTMLHINLRGYLSHIAETTALLRSMDEKPFLVALNETFLTKAIEHVELEGHQVLARRDREGQWGGGVLVFIFDEYAPRVTAARFQKWRNEYGFWRTPIGDHT